jgi:hypothetical protein
MKDVVALVVGVASYPGLEGWNVANDCTVNDAIAVAKSLVKAGVQAEKIKLLLSSREQLPSHIEGIAVEPAKFNELQTFVAEELGDGKFAGKRFFLFWSGHGVLSQDNPQTLVVLADSLKRPNSSQRVLKFLGIEQLATQLQGEPSPFEELIFCVNACRTPIEWSLSAEDETMPVKTFKSNRPTTVTVSRFFAVDEGHAAPVESGASEFSNGFARAVRDCIASWPSQHRGWNRFLRDAWPRTWSPDRHSGSSEDFIPLRKRIRELDRTEQRDLMEETLKYLSQRSGEPIEWCETIVVFHSCHSDQLTSLIRYIEQSFIEKKLVTDGIHRAKGWPDRKLSLAARKKYLFDELIYRLTNRQKMRADEKVADALAALGTPRARVVYIEVTGPCADTDAPLIQAMKAFWKEVIESVYAHKKRPQLPLLIIGHVDPDEKSSGHVDSEMFYVDDALGEVSRRRLNLIEGHHVFKWLDVVAPADRVPWRDDLETQIAVALGGALIENIEATRMARVVNVVAKLAGEKQS